MTVDNDATRRRESGSDTIDSVYLVSFFEERENRSSTTLKARLAAELAEIFSFSYLIFDLQRVWNDMRLDLAFPGALSPDRLHRVHDHAIRLLVADGIVW